MLKLAHVLGLKPSTDGVSGSPAQLLIHWTTNRETDLKSMRGFIAAAREAKSVRQKNLFLNCAANAARCVAIDNRMIKFAVRELAVCEAHESIVDCQCQPPF